MFKIFQEGIDRNALANGLFHKLGKMAKKQDEVKRLPQHKAAFMNGNF